MMPPPEGPPAPALDADGRFRMGARLSWTIVGTYAVLIVLLVVVVGPRLAAGYDWALIFLVALTALFLLRYLSTRYAIDDTYLHAWRVLGGRRVALEDVRAIEYVSFRDLAPGGNAFGVGSWGWRGRMYSPIIGDFDSIYTDAVSGLLVTAGAYPLYISPRHPEAFARELSRRVRSYTGPLEKDVGAPGSSAHPVGPVRVPGP